MALGAIVTPRAYMPSPASAQVILRRAASAHLPPNHALHLVYRSWDSGGQTGSEDIWQEWDGHGALTRWSVWDRSWSDGTMTQAIHSVQSGDRVRVYRYLPRSLVVFVSSYPGGSGGSGVFGQTDFSDGAGVARFLAGLAHHPKPDARLLPDRTLGGAPVHVVLVRTAPGYPAATLYIDARSYLLRGVDGGSRLDREVPSMRLQIDQVVPLSAVPPSVFKLTTEGLVAVPEP
jgi:hypothetical protein